MTGLRGGGAGNYSVVPVVWQTAIYLLSLSALSKLKTWEEDEIRTRRQARSSFPLSTQKCSRLLSWQRRGKEFKEEEIKIHTYSFKCNILFFQDS